MTDISESGIELLPCPLCGDAMVMSRSGRVAEHDDVHQDCPLWITKLYPDGFAAWNRRHPPASREEGLRVKALEWKDRGVWATADCLTGRYEIDDVNGLWHTLGPGGFVSRGHASIPDAKLAAQEHYTNAVLSAIETALIPTKPEAGEGR